MSFLIISDDIRNSLYPATALQNQQNGCKTQISLGIQIIQSLHCVLSR